MVGVGGVRVWGRVRRFRKIDGKWKAGKVEACMKLFGNFRFINVKDGGRMPSCLFLCDQELTIVSILSTVSL